MQRIPWVNYGLIGANVLIFVFQMSNGTSAGLLLQPFDLRWYQLITSAFLHADPLHLIGNMVFLWVFGNAVNDRLGHAGYLGAYLGLAILGDVGYLALGGDRPCLGASGAICGVVGAFFILLAGTRVKVILLMRRIVSRVLELPALLVIGFWILEDVAYMAYQPHSGVAYSAHVSGYIAGAILASVALAARWVERTPDDITSFWSPVHRAPSAEPVRPLYDPLRRPPKRW